MTAVGWLVAREGGARVATLLRAPLVIFVLRRLFALVGILAILLVATFFMIRLVHADPVRQLAGADADAETVEQIRQSLGLDRPLLEQFIDYVSGALRGDLGRSYTVFAGEPAVKIIAERLPASAALTVAALALVMIIAIPLGIVAGVLTREGRHRSLEVLFTAVSSVIGSIPPFLTATFLTFVFAVWLAWLPVGFGPRTPLAIALVLPAASIAIGPIFILARIVRVEVLNVLAQDYIRTARAKRLPARILYARHALPNVLTAALTLAGTLFSSLLAGAVIVENVFSWPGLGTRLVQAVLIGDFPVVQGMVLLLGVAVVLVNATVDLILGLFDPRSLVR